MIDFVKIYENTVKTDKEAEDRELLKDGQGVQKRIESSRYEGVQ